MTIVVGDLHGKLDIAKTILNTFQDERIIFVGDYMDSFDQTTETHIDLLELLLTIQDERDVITLMGNHELSYLMPETQSCSGYRYAIQQYLDNDPSLIHEMYKKLKTYAWEQGWLITHAGVSADWLPANPKMLPQCLDVPPCTQRLYDIGRSRGGYDAVGGPFWCDYYREFIPIKGVKQIFGHTANRPQLVKKHIVNNSDNHNVKKCIVNNGDNYNIDCLDHCKQVLRITNGSVEILDL